MSPLNSKATRRARRDFRYFLTYQTRWSDNDQYSHVNNAIYYHLIDSIVDTYLIKHCSLIPSLSAEEERQLPEVPPIGFVVSSYCNYFSPFSFPESIILGLRVVHIGKSSVSYEVGFFSEPNLGDQEGHDMAKAVGGYTHVFVDRIHRRPVKEMNAKLKNGLQAVLVNNSPAGSSPSKL